MSHYKKVCQYGFTHETCRCTGPHSVINIDCPTPDKHGKTYTNTANLDVPAPTVVDSTHERVQAALYELVEKRFWYLLPNVQRDIVNDIEAALIKAKILAS